MGVNAALYSRKIMHYASVQLESFDDIANCDYDINDYYNIDPLQVLSNAYEQTTRDAANEGLVGSTTAMIVIIRDDELRIANIGDCGLMLIRNGEAIFRSEEQQHSFNFPYQLGTGRNDLPSEAQRYNVKVHEGDIVILGSDGIFDNVFDEEILDIVKHTVKGRNPAFADPQTIADALLVKARDVAEDTKTLSSPFQTRAIQEGLYYQGGKMDDITIVTGIITFEGINWVSKGALPFGFRNRFVWYTSFTAVTSLFFLIPFINTEMKVGPLRAAEKAKQQA
ncbi:hypothetical protein HDU96_006454 [Phlyctochytrium bullatum]|nr:hypothetical protein HDU96_006454 [Phlyctochytrium bullatum]